MLEKLQRTVETKEERNQSETFDLEIYSAKFLEHRSGSSPKGEAMNHGALADAFQTLYL